MRRHKPPGQTNPVDDCVAYLHQLRWSVGDFRTSDGRWHVYGHRSGRKIVGRGRTQPEAWTAAVMAAEGIR